MGSVLVIIIKKIETDFYCGGGGREEVRVG